MIDLSGIDFNALAKKFKKGQGPSCPVPSLLLAHSGDRLTPLGQVRFLFDIQSVIAFMEGSAS